MYRVRAEGANPLIPEWAAGHMKTWEYLKDLYLTSNTMLEFSGVTWTHQPAPALLIMPPEWTVVMRSVLSRQFIYQSMWHNVIHITNDQSVDVISSSPSSSSEMRVTCDYLPCKSAQVCIFHDREMGRYVLLGKQDTWA